MSRDRDELGPLFRAATARRREETVRGKGPAALDRIFGALEEHGCDPELTADGRGIVASCPCCRGERALVVELPTDGEPKQ